MIYDERLAVLNDGSGQLLALANQLNIPVVDTLIEVPELYLTYINDQLYLCKKDINDVLKISVDFVSSQLQFRRQHISLKSEPLLRAVGCSQKKQLYVVDATAGLGRDSFLLANYNCNVTLLEQSPVIAALLEDGLYRASHLPELATIVSNMHLIKQNASEYLQEIANQPDVVYLDPMFPARSKAAKVKKEMQVLHALLGSSVPEDDINLFQISMQKVKGRVVVKRPKTADFLANKKPSYSLDTKAMRFDVYVKT